MVSEIRSKTKCQIGIHTHNDTETAVASSLVALYSCAKQIQCTVNGYGERCGNANLLTIIGIYSGIVCHDNIYNIALGILIGEITNPLHQTMDFYKIIKHRNISVEIFYLVSIMLTRLGIGTCALLSTINDVYSFNGISNLSNGCIYSYSITIITYILLIPLSFNWSHKKYQSIHKYLRIRTNK